MKSKRGALILAVGLTFLFFGLGQSAEAQVKHELLRRLAVFPIAGATGNPGEEAWWQMRELLTKNQRFLVASRRFMINRGVFQARNDLKPADAIILAKILDAQALMITNLNERKLSLKVMDGENGFVLWEGVLELHPAIPVNDQINQATQKLVGDFLSDIPYQGFLVIDALRDKSVFEEGGQKKAWVFLGDGHRVEKGDNAQWVEVRGETSKVFFKGGAQSTVVAEGVVIERMPDRVLVQIDRLRSLDDLTENSLVRFPREVKLLKELYMSEDRSANLSTEYLSAELKKADEVEKRHSSTSTSLAFIFNAAVFILMAF